MSLTKTTAWGRRLCLSFGCLAISMCIPVPDFPAHLADITFNEDFTQTFLVDDRPPQAAESTYFFLVGNDAARVLSNVKSAQEMEIKKTGALEVYGSFSATAHVDPFDSTLFTVDGQGHFGVFTRELVSELLISGTIEVGDDQEHSLTDLSKLQLILPIRHQATVNPVLLLNRTKLSGNGAECSVTLNCKECADQSPINCNAPGLGTPHPASYFVKVHLREVAGNVYAIDLARKHELFRELPDRTLDVFGCLSLTNVRDCVFRST